ncbi:MAG: GNAT family N-acetyltransferase [Anaerolineales bacterium]|nr:GNAT family N-acetyltransferase [Anaerolineales bacterium]
MQIVHLSTDDFDEICQLWQAAGLPFKPAGRDNPTVFAEQMASGVQTPIGIRGEDGQLIGVALATHDSRKGWINRIAVHPNSQRQGVGAALITACEQHFEQLGLLIVAALVEADNTASLNLFLHEGYQQHDSVIYFSKRASDNV